MAKKKKTKKGVLKNNLEKAVHKQLQALWGKRNVLYEKEVFEYTVPEAKHKYTADFTRATGGIIVEAKGKWDATDRKKMLLIKEQFPLHSVYMYFQDANKKIRKGSKTSYADWCDKNGIKWTDLKRGLPKTWS